ncbi:Bifunctional inhibitor/plant lipid transfer protein/seed storage helical domain [Sesbania bispinosa]|nr:Bifunctional inhibitor/plant lipid transfer protein/seed storage helical domain [Sesbania bispinosa]
MMSKFVCFLVVLIVVTAAVAESHLDEDKVGPCGKFSIERMLTHKLRHCEKAARDVNVAVSTQCCKAVAKLNYLCRRAIFSSDALEKVGINPKVAITIPRRCHLIYD